MIHRHKFMLNALFTGRQKQVGAISALRFLATSPIEKLQKQEPHFHRKG